MQKDDIAKKLLVIISDLPPLTGESQTRRVVPPLEVLATSVLNLVEAVRDVVATMEPTHDLRDNCDSATNKVFDYLKICVQRNLSDAAMRDFAAAFRILKQEVKPLTVLE